MELSERISTQRPVATQAGTDSFAEVKNRIHLAIISQLGPLFSSVDIEPRALAERVRADIREQLTREPGIAREDRERLVGQIADDILGHGPLERPLADDAVTEIMINGPHDVWVERKGRLHATDIQFTDESHLRRIINKIVAQVGRRVDESSPMVDARLPDGSRVNAVLPPLSLSGPLVTIRKFSKVRWGLGDMVNMGTLSSEAVEFLEACVKAELNILIDGGTGSGKTTLLNAMSTAVPNDDRIVTIEDAAELRLNQRHVLRLEARPKNIEGEGEIPIRELVKNSLRMRPDRIIVGEVRGAEALDMLQAMNTGHDGSLCTVHANTPRDAISRIETMVLMAGYDLPIRAIRQQIASALDLIVHLERLQDGSRRVTSITEVQRMEGDVITLQELFEFKVDTVTSEGTVIGGLRPTGLRPTFLNKFELRGIPLPSDGGAVAPASPGGHGASNGNGNGHAPASGSVPDFFRTGSK
jgi:pilus assembly protein CpaF